MIESGTIFLSHRASDKIFVEGVMHRLDLATTFYDIRSMEPGQATIDAMKTAVAKSSVFVLFHNENEPSPWVEFEKSLAEVQKIINPSLQILVCPIGSSTYKTLPDWMKAFFSTTPEYKKSDIARTIRLLYQKNIDQTDSSHVRTYPGREVQKRELSLLVMRFAASGAPLSALVVSGLQGMGRGTFAAELVRDAYRGMRPGGPIFDIPDAGDAVDWHLAFYNELQDNVGPELIADQIAAFEKLTDTQKALSLASALKHWGKVNQVVTIRHRWGLRGTGSSLKPWLTELLQLLEREPSVRVILISERKIPPSAIIGLKNVMHCHLEELDDSTIEYILAERINSRYMDAQRLPELASKINGHPATANYVSFLVGSGRSMDSLVLSPNEIYAFQDTILKTIFETDTLSETQSAILHLLSWFPTLSATMIAEVFNHVDRAKIVNEIWTLAEYSLINQTNNGRYSAPAVVSSTYRRRSSVDQSGLIDKVTLILNRQFDEGVLDYDLIDSLVVAVTSSGSVIPTALRRLLTPSRLLPAIEKEYYDGLRVEGSNANVHFDRCKSLASLALTMPIADDDLENLLFFGADASVRLGEYPEQMVSKMRVKGMLTADYIEGSYLYHKARDYPKAASVLSKTLSSTRFRVRNVRLLVRIYLREGKFNLALDALSNLPDHRLVRDTGLMIMKIKALKGTRNWPEAKRLAAMLVGRSDEYGDIALYKASEALREGRYADAFSAADAASKAPKANQAIISILKCACQIEDGNLSELSNTCAVARSIGRDSDALQLQARAALSLGDWRSALDYIYKVQQRDWFDLNIEIRALDMSLKDSDASYDPVFLNEKNSQREDALRAIANAVEGTNFAAS